MCLHPRGCLRIPTSSTTKLVEKECDPGVYYTGINGERKGDSLGLGDFLGYNVLLLIVLPESSSMSTQILLTLGCIICIDIGYILAGWLTSIWKEIGFPGVPLPVIVVSVYVLFLDIIMENPSQCDPF
jgi:hypothetical protein